MSALGAAVLAPVGSWPRFAFCRCGAAVMFARPERGRPVKLNPSPVIVGEAACPACKGKGQRTVPMPATVGRRVTNMPGDLEGKTTKGTMTSCIVCEGTGRRGEALDSELHVVMSEHGVIRGDGIRGSSWDSVYHRHVCLPLR
jgi:hypothetical protein